MVYGLCSPPNDSFNYFMTNLDCKSSSFLIPMFNACLEGFPLGRSCNILIDSSGTKSLEGKSDGMRNQFDSKFTLEGVFDDNNATPLYVSQEYRYGALIAFTRNETGTLMWLTVDGLEWSHCWMMGNTRCKCIRSLSGASSSPSPSVTPCCQLRWRPYGKWAQIINALAALSFLPRYEMSTRTRADYIIIIMLLGSVIKASWNSSSAGWWFNKCHTITSHRDKSDKIACNPPPSNPFHIKHCRVENTCFIELPPCHALPLFWRWLSLNEIRRPKSMHYMELH